MEKFVTVEFFHADRVQLVPYTKSTAEAFDKLRGEGLISSATSLLADKSLVVHGSHSPKQLLDFAARIQKCVAGEGRILLCPASPAWLGVDASGRAGWAQYEIPAVQLYR